MKRYLLFLIATSLIIFTKYLCAGETHILREKNFTILFEAPLSNAAKEAADLYPAVKVELERILAWDMNLRPTVLLIKENEDFQKITKDPLIVAFAVPGKNVIVIDHSKMSLHPFSLEVTMKHELCHLLLHDHIGERILPKWFDEGVCQWVSGGIGELIMDQKRSLLNKATLRGTFLSLRELQHAFPYDKEFRLLAYEESKSFVDYILSKFGREGILRVLERMKKGEAVDMAISEALSVTLEKLEKEWHSSLRRRMTWFTYFSYHLYEILFGLMALIAIYASIRIIMRKRAYGTDETEKIFDGH